MVLNTTLQRTNIDIDDSDFCSGDTAEIIDKKIKFYLYKKALERYPVDFKFDESQWNNKTNRYDGERNDINKDYRERCFKELLDDFFSSTTV